MCTHTISNWASDVSKNEKSSIIGSTTVGLPRVPCLVWLANDRDGNDDNGSDDEDDDVAGGTGVESCVY